jgi:hypothetical protein
MNLISQLFNRNMQSSDVYARSIDNTSISWMTWISLLGVSFFVGLCCVFLPWWLNVALVALVTYTATLLLAPWLGFTLYVLIVLFSPDFKIADVATVFTLLIFTVQVLRKNVGTFKFPNAIRSTLLVFTGLILFSFTLSFLYFHNQIPYIYRDGRAFIYWLWIPLLWRLMANESDAIIKLGRVFFAVATTVALIALFEAVTGIQIIAIGLVGALDTAGAASQSAFTRVQMPGFLYVMWAVVWLSLSLLYRKINYAVGAVLLIIFAAAIFVNFGRALWIWTFIAVITPIFFIGRRRATNFIASAFVIIVLGTTTLAVVHPSTLDAVAVRLLSVKDEGGRNTSYGWREWENQDAIATLKRSPLVGVGIGGEYRPWIRILAIFAEHTRYIHDSYLYIALKIGIPGLLCLLWLFWQSWNRGRRVISLIAEKNKLVILACVSFFPAIMGLSLTQPEFMNPYSIVLFASLIALFASPRLTESADVTHPANLNNQRE